LVVLVLIVALTAAMGLLALRVSADETVVVGTEADRIYITDGFYDPEQSTENGIYRWTQPLAQLVMPDWGPGRVHVAISGVGVSPGKAVLKIAGVPLDQANIQPRQPWTLQAWGVSSSRNPTVTLEAPAFNPLGDSRTLGLLVKSLEIYAPDARIRALVNIILLGLAGALLFLFLLLRTSNLAVAAIAGLSVPALLTPLAAYRDVWMDTVAWVAPVALLALLFVELRRKPTTHYALRTTHYALIALALTLGLFLLYMGYVQALDKNLPSQMNAFDSERMYQMTAGIAEYGRPTRYPGLETWTKYGFGQSLIAVPFYLVGKLGVLLGGSFDRITRLIVSLTNLAVTALTCLLLYRASRRFTSPTISFAVAATYLLATPALNYARTFFSEPAGGLLLLAALLLIIPPASDEPLRPRRILLAGICLGSMILFKPAFAIYLPVPALAVLWLTIRDQGAVVDRRSSVVHRLTPLALFAVGPIAALVVQAGYNYVRYSPLPDAILRTGYEKEPGFSTPLLEGLGGILLSPGKSIFLYAPVLLLAPLGLWLMYRRREASGRLTAVLLLAEIVVGLVFNSLWWAWTGNFAWGPRLIMPVLPLMVWPLAALSQVPSTEYRVPNILRSTRARSVLLGAWVVLGVLGAIVSISGALVDFQVYFRSYGLLLAGDPGESVTIYDPANSPLLVEPGYFLNGLTAAIHRPSLAATGMPPIWDVIVPAGLVALALLFLWYGTRSSRDKTV
jgi:hypothetical protein